MYLPRLKLISHKLCPYVQRARIVLNEKSVPHEIEFIDLANKPEWFLEISPLGRVPVLLTDERPIFESAVIAEYLDEITEGSMLPGDPLEKAGNRAWIEYASDTLAAIGSFYAARGRERFDSSAALLVSRFETLEGVLTCKPYFNGEQFSLVDAAFAPVFRYFEVIEQHVDLGFFNNTPRVTAWREALARRPSVRHAVVADYGQRLQQFFVDRESYLTDVIRGQCAA